jgi:hypothetical protein
VASVVDTAWQQFATGVVDTDGEFATGVTTIEVNHRKDDTGVAPLAAFIFMNFRKIRNSANSIFSGPG